MNEISDIEIQKKILAEDKKMQKQNKKYFVQITCMILFIVLILAIAYITVYVYKDKGLLLSSNCQNINKEDPFHTYDMINISDNNSCKAKYNIDYHGNGKVLFNIDIYGDKSKLFNETNIKDKNGKCTLNCDIDEDGFPDYNIDLNGDKKADLNIGSAEKCDNNCDKDYDMVIDSVKVKTKDNIGNLNIDIDYDGICDVNCDVDNDFVPDRFIDTDSDYIPDKMIDINSDGICDLYCEEALNLKDEKTQTITINDKKSSNDVKINLSESTPGSEFTINVIIKNNNKKAINYDLNWKDVVSDYNEYNSLNYVIEKNNQIFNELQKMPLEVAKIGSGILAPKRSVKYTIKIQTNYTVSNTVFEGKININITK